MEKVERLAEVLRKLDGGEVSPGVRAEAKRLLAEVSPAELSLAEQKLVEDGMRPETLRKLCDVHLELLDDQLAPARGALPEGHVLDTLYKEHDEILGFLDKLDAVNGRIQRKATYEAGDRDYDLLRHLADHLVGAEKHHAREEDVLFPELEKRGVSGPPRIMRMEHDDFRPRKRRLLEVADRAVQGAPELGTPDGFATFKRDVAELAPYIGFRLRDHIFKENTILYPTALETIDDEATWRAMKDHCDAIGYCCFSPVAKAGTH